MEPTGVKRKLAVILAADAEGYTRLMREAEEPTLETLTDYRAIIDSLIARMSAMGHEQTPRSLCRYVRS